MSTKAAIAMAPYREPNTGMVGLVPDPKDNSSDNGLLFTATYLALLTPEAREDERAWFSRLVVSCMPTDGVLTRSPGDSRPDTVDDATGVATASYLLGLPYARLIYDRGTRHNWNYRSDNQWDWNYYLFRFTGFSAFMKSAAGLPLKIHQDLWAALGFLGNLFEKREETSGKCLLMLRARVLYGKGFFTDLAIALWAWRMRKLYPGGPSDVYAIYFPSNPWFKTYAPKGFV